MNLTQHQILMLISVLQDSLAIQNHFTISRDERVKLLTEILFPKGKE